MESPFLARLKPTAIPFFGRYRGKAEVARTSGFCIVCPTTDMTPAGFCPAVGSRR